MGEDKEGENDVDIELVAKNANKAPDAEEGNSTKRQLTVLEFTKKAFRDSLLTGVSNIVNSNSIPRKTYKSVVILLCLIGFTYQITVFFQDVLTYPTKVSVNIERPNMFIQPGYTFCQNSLIKRSKFCAKFPDSCTRPDDIGKFCKVYPFYFHCKENSKDFKIPDIKEAAPKVERNFTKELLPELGYDLKSLLIEDSDDSEAVEGPFLMGKEENTFFSCYTKYARVDSPLPVKLYEKKAFSFLEPSNSFVFDPEEEELLYYNGRAGIYFAVHNPFERVNPYQRGVFLRPGRDFNIFVRLEVQKLLPFPYDTNCLNYTDRWLKNNRVGVRSQEMCKQKCLMDISIKCFGCVDPAIIYPTDEEFCRGDDRELCDVEVFGELFSCEENCKDDCKRTRFIYEVKEQLPSGNVLSLSSLTKNDSNSIRVDVYIEDSEVMVLNFKPEHQIVEIFSFIGGFLGIWLGFCLISVADFFESIFDIFRYIYRTIRRK